jgi:hypothetical protein
MTLRWPRIMFLNSLNGMHTPTTTFSTCIYPASSTDCRPSLARSIHPSNSNPSDVFLEGFVEKAVRLYTHSPGDGGLPQSLLTLSTCVPCRAGSPRYPSMPGARTLRRSQTLSTSFRTGLRTTRTLAVSREHHAGIRPGYSGCLNATDHHQS